jgi:hypothetical protein
MQSRIFLIIICIALSCKIKQNDRIERIEVFSMLQDGDKRVYLDELVGNVRYVPLETNNECIIGEIEKIVADSNNYYILDFQEKLFVFNSITGKNKFTLNKQGKGPGEYVDIVDFTISPDGKIVINDSGLRKLLVYEESGHFIKEIDLSFGVLSLNFFNENTLILYSPHQFSENNRPFVAFLDLSSEKIISKIEFSSNTTSNSRYISPCDFSQVGNKSYIKIPFGDTIYSIEGTDIIPNRYLDFSNNRIPEELYSDIERYHKSRNDYIEWSDYTESSNYFFFTVRFENELKRVILNKITGEHILIDSKAKSKPGITFSQYINYLIWPVYSKNDFFVSYIEAYSFVENFSLASDSLDFNQISKDDNPIIIHCMLK